jgi:hypothetical protein
MAIQDPEELTHVRHGTGTDDGPGLEKIVGSVVRGSTTFEFRLHYRTWASPFPKVAQQCDVLSSRRSLRAMCEVGKTHCRVPL